MRAQGDAVCITDGNLDPPGPRILFVNDAFTQLTGWTPADIAGKTPRALQGPLTEKAVIADLRNRLETGRRFEGETVNYRADGTPFIMHWTVDPVMDATGTRSHFVAVQRDVTPIRLLEHLHAADRELATTTMALADGDDLDLATAAATRRIYEAVDAMLYVGEPFVVTRLGGRWITVPECDGTARSRLVGLVRSHRKPAEMRHEGTVRLIAPFAAAGVPGGFVVDSVSPPTVGLVSLDHVAELATTAGNALHALSAIAARRREALAVQRVLLPAAAYDIDGFEVFAHYTPSRRTEQAGGDWYDALVVDGRVRIVIGDVVGKGLRAAGEMGLIRSHLRALLASGAPLEAVVAEADEFCRAEEMMATAAIVDIEATTGALQVVSAGHPAPLLVEHATARFLSVAPVAPLGSFRTPGPEAKPITDVLAGGTLLLYTDGVFDERRTGLGTGLEWLRATLAGVEGAAASIGRAVVAAAGGERDDDMAVLGISRASA